jgi:hypothetical protein
LALGYRSITSLANSYEIRATLSGDSDLVGQVNVTDLVDLAGNFGKSLAKSGSAEPTATAAGAAVPDPAGAGLVVAVASVATAISRRRHRRLTRAE